MLIRVWTRSAFTGFSFDRVGLCIGFFGFWPELLLCVWGLEEFHILLLLDSDSLVRDTNSIDALMVYEASIKKIGDYNKIKIS